MEADINEKGSDLENPSTLNSFTARTNTVQDTNPSSAPGQQVSSEKLTKFWELGISEGKFRAVQYNVNHALAATSRMVMIGNKRGICKAFEFISAAQELMPQAKHGHPKLSAIFHRLTDASSYLFRSRLERNPASFGRIADAEYLLREAVQMLSFIDQAASKEVGE